jgi:pSer/pThr/pTyr-binding forkhead associated (FHA) protein
VVLGSPLTSRHHARIVVSDGGVTIEDLGSRNGVFLNQKPVKGKMLLRLGDLVMVGDTTLELVETEPPDATEFRRRATQANQRLGAPEAYRPRAFSISEEPDPSAATRRVDAFRLLGGVVDKMLAMGRGDEAERTLSAHLRAVLRNAAQGTVDAELTQIAAIYGAKLAASLSKPEWADYAIELYESQRKAMPVAVVDELYVALRKVRGVNIALLKGYIAELEAERELSPTERFALQRLQGLLRVAALSGRA